MADGRIQFQGRLFDSHGKGVVLMKSPLRERPGAIMRILEAGQPDPMPQIIPIFRYPSELHLGEFVTTVRH